MQEICDFLLGLYRDARECGVEEFKDVAIERIRASLSFTGAFWGKGRLNPGDLELVPTALHARDIDPHFLVDWVRVIDKDPVISMVAANMGRAMRVHVPSVYAGIPEAQEVGRKYHIGSLTVTVVRDVGPCGVQWLSLYRSDPKALCSDTEQRWMQWVVPHLAEATRINQAIQRVVEPMQEGKDYLLAIAELHNNQILRLDPRFADLLSSEWPGFNGIEIPRPLIKMYEHRLEFVHLTRTHRIDGRRIGELIHLYARTRLGAQPLTDRQLMIAELFAQGLTSKQIAQRCAIAPATVRNHLAAVYTVFQVHSKCELTQRINSLRQGR